MSDAPQRRSRSALLLVLAGAGLLLLAAGRPWLHVVLERPAPLPPAARDLAGADLLGWLRPLALLGLAGVPGLLAAGRLGRRLIGLLLLAAGLVTTVQCALLAVGGAPALLARAGRSVLTTASAEATAWPALAAVAGAALAAGSIVVLAGGRAAGLPDRYEAPRRPAEPPPQTSRGEVAAWDALDRGEDPTR